MRQSFDELLHVVYRFYARGLQQYDPGYKDSEEHRRLVQARIQAAAPGNPWGTLLERLALRFPKDQIQNGSLHLPTGGWDAGYVGSLWLPPRDSREKNHLIGSLVSFLVPCYVVYSSAHVAVPSAEPPDWSQQIRFTFSPDEEPHARVLAEEIASTFPDHEPMPPEIGNVVVPDVVAGTRRLGATTLYHCLFTDTW